MWFPIDNGPFTNTTYDRFNTFVKTSHLPVEISKKKKDAINEQVGRYCEELFRSYDYDNDGLLSRGEFTDALDLGLQLRDKVDDFDIFCQNAFDSQDIEQRDRISLEEFVTFYEALKRRMPLQIPKLHPLDNADGADIGASASSAKIEMAQKEFELLTLDEGGMRRIFDLFDADSNGTLDVSEIQEIVKEMGIPDYERDNYVGFIKRSTQMVVDEEKEIKFDDFCALLQSLATAKVDRGYRQLVLKKNDH